jgi:hypothetical protein
MTETQIDELIFVLQAIAGSLQEINENINRVVVHLDVQPEFHVPIKATTRPSE